MDMPLRVQKHIVRLDITMHDVLSVYVTQCTSKLCNPEPNGLFREGFSGNVKSQVAASHEIHNNVSAIAESVGLVT